MINHCGGVNTIRKVLDGLNIYLLDMREEEKLFDFS